MINGSRRPYKFISISSCLNRSKFAFVGPKLRVGILDELGELDGVKDGIPDGTSDAWTLGLGLGCSDRVGMFDGCPEGDADGCIEGYVVGRDDGIFDGCNVGNLLGL